MRHAHVPVVPDDNVADAMQRVVYGLTTRSDVTCLKLNTKICALKSHFDFTLSNYLHVEPLYVNVMATVTSELQLKCLNYSFV